MNQSTVNQQLTLIYQKYQDQKPYLTDLVQLTGTIIPIADNTKDNFWPIAAQQLLQGSLMAMLEDQKPAAQFTVTTLKQILQTAELDSTVRRQNLLKYFTPKSAQCRELVAVYFNNATNTADNIYAYVTIYLNQLGA